MAVTTADSSVEGGPAPAASARSRSSDYTWVWQVTALSLVLGVMLALAVRTTNQGRTTDEPGSRIQVSASLLVRSKEENDSLQQQIVGLRHQVSQYVTEFKGNSGETESLKRQFEQLKAMAGQSRVVGAGLEITVQDSTEVQDRANMPVDYINYLVHDQDLVMLMNELKEAGAQDLAISGADVENLQRVVVTTTARCVGPTAVVNGTYLAAPYHIFAIGDAKRMRSYLERPDGYIHGPRQLDALKMVKIEEADHLELPEYFGAPGRYARPAEGSRGRGRHRGSSRPLSSRL